MKSRLITNNPPPSPAPTFPILKKHVNGKFIVLFFNENSGPVIWVDLEANINEHRIGPGCSMWLSCFDGREWKTLADNDEVVLTNG